MVRQRSLFDIVGPVMIGPSSSHTAGAVRLGLLARAIYGTTPHTARIGLHGSFASTGRGHGTDLALTAGLLGMRPDDPAIRDAMRLAAAAGLSVSLYEIDLSQAHPNTAAFELADETGRQMRVIGSSLGGGDVVVIGIDDFDVEMTGELPVLLVEHQDRPGEIAAVSSVLAEAGVNIASMRVAREARGARAMMVIETDAAVGPPVVDRVAAIPGVAAARRVEAV
ncbi:MAG: L-serine ammonia-lyase, iron-sulfur-dependent subunit beta [Coriobacteriia bacterium]|nr:L-serine ammonia-lyase, iron-sulfur-dependent subunit beta [Coriobacteriia bacterium]